MLSEVGTLAVPTSHIPAWWHVRSSAIIKFATVVGVLVVTLSLLMIPQLKILTEVGDALCGTRVLVRACLCRDASVYTEACACVLVRPCVHMHMRAHLCVCLYVHLRPRVRACVRVCVRLPAHARACVHASDEWGAGGELNFVHGIDKIGEVCWASTVPIMDRNWDERDWRRPNHELATVSWRGKLANAVLSHEYKDSCDLTACTSNTNATPELDRWGFDRCCWTATSKQTVAGLQVHTEFPVEDCVNRNSACSDELNTVQFKLEGYHRAAQLGPALADGMMTNSTSCHQGCFDPFRPLCKEGRCVPVTCADMKPQVSECACASVSA